MEINTAIANDAPSNSIINLFYNIAYNALETLEKITLYLQIGNCHLNTARLGTVQMKMTDSSASNLEHQIQNSASPTNIVASIQREFTLTEAQRIYIQHHLPRCFTLLPSSSSSSRINCNSNLLIQESLIFIERKRGRPEGSTRKNESRASLSRKSLRIASAKKITYNSSRQKSQTSSFQSASCLSKNGKSDEKDNNESVSLMKHPYIPPEEAEAQANSSKQMVKTCKQRKAEAVDLLKITAKVEDVLQLKNSDMPKSNEHSIRLHIALQTTNEVKSLQKKISTRKSFKDNTEKKQISFDHPLLSTPVRDRAEIKAQIIEQKTQQSKKARESNEKQQKFEAQGLIIRRLKAHKQILPFLQPVEEVRDGAPNYYREISTPIDLQTIQFKLSTGIYKLRQQFHSDVRLMWANSKSYNRRNTYMQRITDELQNYYLNLLSRTTTARRQKSSPKMIG